jgi:hypothetical protein
MKEGTRARRCDGGVGRVLPKPIVDLKGKRTATLLPDKVAVLNEGQSIGCCLSTGANDRSECGIAHGFTVISPGLLRPAGWGAYAERGKRGCPALHVDQWTPPPI